MLSEATRMAKILADFVDQVATMTGFKVIIEVADSQRHWSESSRSFFLRRGKVGRGGEVFAIVIIANEDFWQ